MSRLIVVTGTQREAAVLDQRDMAVIAGGGEAEALRRRLHAAAPGAEGIVSFGFAGALADGLAIGDWIVGTKVTGAISAVCDPAWSAALLRQLPAAQTGAIYADGRLIGDVAEKRALGTRHAALGVDMESHIAAEVAAERALPFVIARCISDPVSRALPPAIALAMRPDGSVGARAMAISLATRPGQLADFVRAIGGFMRAMASLREGARHLALAEALRPHS